jgi:hypothetical protein
MSDLDLEDVLNHSGHVQVPSSLLQVGPSSGRYTAVSFADAPDEWLA